MMKIIIGFIFMEVLNRGEKFEQWAEYDNYNRIIYYKSSRFNYEQWREYDESNEKIYYKTRI